MLKVVLVDDERPALRGLEHLLKRYADVSVVGMYINPIEGLEEIGKLKPNAVFLDINMPQLKGIDAASSILESSPNTDIVFVTAFDRYAVEAFELHALDYLLKPVKPERLDKTIERLTRKKPVLTESCNKQLQIKCLGRLQISWKDREPIKWRTEKTKELFAFLLHNKDRDMSKDEILDTLWTEDDPDKAIRQLYNGIYYIRKALEDYGIVRSAITIDSNYHMKLCEIQVDAEKFYELENGDSEYSIEKLEELEALYAGDYLGSEYYTWADSERKKLEDIYLRCLFRLAQKHSEKEHWDKAEHYLLKAYNKNPYEEKTTELLLRLYARAGEKGKAIKHLKAYSDLIRAELGIEPDIKLKELIS